MFNHILVPLDGSALAECVLPHVAALAATFESRVTLLLVLEQRSSAGPMQAVDPLEWRFRKAEAEAYLAGLTDGLRRVGVHTESSLLEGQAADRIVAYARASDVDLLVLSSHGRSGLSPWNMSGVVQKILLRAHTSTMIVRAYQPMTGRVASVRYRRLLVPLDGSQRAESVVPLATTLARHHESQLLIVHVARPPEMPRRAPSSEDLELANRLTERNRQEAMRYLEYLQSHLPPEAEVRLLVGDDVAATLHELVEAEGIDLVMLCAHGYSGKNKWPYGSITSNFVAYGATPLLIVQDLSADEIEPTRAEVAAREHAQGTLVHDRALR
ncbi:MAG: universal stress protein [Ardenticatenaceae bacterium]|nr:universal stress protein [Ardenticatenaceae bacterium]